MLTAEKILEKWYKPLNRIGTIAGLQLVEAMKEYAKQVAEQALKDASENVRYNFMYQNMPDKTRRPVGVEIDKQSILNTEIKLP